MNHNFTLSTEEVELICEVLDMADHIVGVDDTKASDLCFELTYQMEQDLEDAGEAR